MSTTQFGSPDAKRLYDVFSNAADGVDNRAVLEVAAVMVAQAISSGSFTLGDALNRVTDMSEGMKQDISRNWDRVIAARKARRQ